MWSLIFWKDTAERAISTAAESALALLGIDGLGLVDVDWAAVGSLAGLAGVVAVLKALVASRAAGDPTSASFVDTPGRHAAPEA